MLGEDPGVADLLAKVRQGLARLPKHIGAAPRTRPAGWTRGDSMPTARNSLLAATIGGRLFVVGGHDGKGDSPVLEVYDPATDSWRRLAALPKVDSGNAGRYGGAVGVIDGKLYLAGGWRIRPPIPTRSLLIYDPGTDRWRRGANMPTLSACSVAGVIRRRLYVLTACDGHSGFRKSLHVYDPDRNAWSRLRDARHAHADAAVGVIGGKLYVAGGGEWGKPTPALEVYDPGTNRWSAKAPMSAARAGAAAGVIDGKLYVVGGSIGKKLLATLEIYDPATNGWRTGPPMPSGRSSLAAAVIGRRLYAVGGYDGKRCLGLLEVFRPGAVSRTLRIPRVRNPR